jgi:hypothetical protein
MATEYKIDFSHRHPEWQRMIKRWQMAFDFWRGGIHVIAPDHDISAIEFAASTSDESGGLENEDTGELSDFRWVPDVARSYLWKHDRESSRQYDDRSARAIHLPVFQYVINVLTAGVLKISASRGNNEQIQFPWDIYWTNVDLAGTNIDSFIRQALTLSWVFGRIHAITDVPYIEQDVKNRGEQLAKDLRPYSYLVTPIDLVDWSIDRYGQFQWVVIREDMPDARQPGNQACVIENQYRVWTREKWELWVPKASEEDGQENVEYELLDEGYHGLNRVPLDTLWATKDSKQALMQCESPLADVLDLDRDCLNKMSELDELERMQSFGLLCIPEAEGTSIGSIDVSPFSALKIPSEAGMPRYVSPDTGLANGKWQRVQEKMMVIRQLAGASRGKSEYSKEERSAEALAAENEDKKNQMAAMAAATEEFDNALHRTVLAWIGKSTDVYPQPHYPKTFDVKGTFTKIAELVQLNSTDILSPFALAELVKPIVSGLLKENGLPPEKIKQVEKELDSQALRLPLVDVKKQPTPPKLDWKIE